MTFYGEFRCKLDAKGRLRLPGQLISQLGLGDNVELVLNRGFEQCLFLYPVQVWEGIAKELRSMNIYDQETRMLVRFLNRGALKLSPDNSDRILIPKTHLEYASIQKEVVITPLNDRFEIWPAEEYDDIYLNTPKNLSDLAQRVLGDNKSME